MADALYIPMTTAFDSDEERFFQWWIDDLVAAGYIDRVVYQPESFVTVPKQHYQHNKRLKTKVREDKKVLAQQRVYTPDFTIYWNIKALNIFYKELTLDTPVDDDIKAPLWAMRDADDNLYSIIEVKGTFDAKNMTRLAAINIDIVSHLYGVRIEMVKIGNKKNAFFAKTFTPSRYFLTDKTAKPRKLSYPALTLAEYVRERVQ